MFQNGQTYFKNQVINAEDLVYLVILAPYALKGVNKTQPSSFLAEFGVKSIRRDGDITHNSQYVVTDSTHNVFDTAFVKVAIKNQMNNAMICRFCVKRLIIGIYNVVSIEQPAANFIVQMLLNCEKPY